MITKGPHFGTEMPLGGGHIINVKEAGTSGRVAPDGGML